MSAKKKFAGDSQSEIEHNPIYFPILKAKAGEFKALKVLSNEIRAQITPILEVPPVSYDFIQERPSKSIISHLRSVIKGLSGSMGKIYPFYFDLNLLEENTMDNGDYIFNFLLENFRAKNMRGIPVLWLGIPNDILLAIQGEIQKLGTICIRLDQNSINDFDIEAEIRRITDNLGIEISNVDIVLDFGYFKNDQESILTSFSKSTINDLFQVENYNRLILSMTSFPENLSGINGDSITRVRRSEWAVWQELMNSPKLKRKPNFSDYAVSNPLLTEIDPRIIQMSASIRYTIENEWLILKGRGVKAHGFEQFFELSNKLVNETDEFYGEEFSQGDELIFEKSQGEGGTGNATTWRHIGTNHHIHVVVNRLTAN